MNRSNLARTLVRLMAGATLAGTLAVLPASAQGQSTGRGAASHDAGTASRGDGGGLLGGDGHGGGARHSRAKVTPYIEATQVIAADLSPSHEVLTWTGLAVGVDANIQGRNTEAAASVRYERRFGWGRADNIDTITGIARGSVAIVPQALALEAGGVATRATADGRGAAVPGSFSGKDSTHIYSVYAGPSLRTRVGDVGVTGAYRAGYTEVGTSTAVRTNGVQAGSDTFDHSVTHNAQLHAGVRPGDVLPVGLGVGAGYAQEDVSNLDQRVKDFHARADVTVPVSTDLALVGGIGYEKVSVSSRDVVRDASGAAVIGSDGRWVTDRSVPRQIAYDTSGFIWDVGLTWRPSRRTAFEAHVGRRYGSTTYYGSFGWQASRRSTLNVAVYDSISGFGGQLNRALVALPTDFEALRNPATGDLNGCVAGGGAASAGNDAPVGPACLTNAFSSLRSAVFRARGVQASYGVDLGRLGVGVAGGYDRRRFIAAPGSVLASVNGVVDENTWASAWLKGRIDDDSSFGTYVYADWYRTAQVGGGEGTAIGASASYSRQFGHHLSANASIAIQGLQRPATEDYWQASALLGLRYSFF